MSASSQNRRSGVRWFLYEEPVRASTASAAAMDKGTATTPMRLARAIDGLAPVPRAARSHKSHASDPVTNRLSLRRRRLDQADEARIDSPDHVLEAIEVRGLGDVGMACSS